MQMMYHITLGSRTLARFYSLVLASHWLRHHAPLGASLTAVMLPSAQRRPNQRAETR